MLERRHDKHDRKRDDTRRRFPRRTSPRFQMTEKMDIDYKNFNLLLKFLTDRGKIVPRRVSSVSAKDQRKLTRAIKIARFMGLLPSGAASAR